MLIPRIHTQIHNFVPGKSQSDFPNGIGARGDAYVLTAASDSRLRRLARTATRLAELDFAPLAYALSLRYHRLEFGSINYVSSEKGKGHGPSGGPLLTRVIRCLQVPEGSVAVNLGVGWGSLP